MSPETTPIIAGIGEITDRPRDPATALEPLALMEAACHLADHETNGLLASTDSLDIINQVTWPYENTAQTLCHRLGITPARAEYGHVGGETPVAAIHKAALRIAAGQSRIAVITGAEAQHALSHARKAGITLPWTPPAKALENPTNLDGLYNPLALLHEVFLPSDIYPLYENAALIGWNQTPEAARAESGEIWASFAARAAQNPFSWQTHAFTAQEITTPTPENRLIAWPYTKRMVANPQVNQGAALILTTLAIARQAGIAEEKLIHIIGGAHANEPRDYLARDQYGRSDAQNITLRRTAEHAGQAIDLYELYSCFPIVPKMARRALNLPETIPVTVTGGLSFFGAPLNTYMTHAACAMVRALRLGEGNTGLLYGQGEFVTKHHTLLLSRAPAGQAPWSINAQTEVDRARAAVPPLAADYAGPASLETFTLLYDRAGAARFAMILALTPQGSRAVARLDAKDEAGIAKLTNPNTSPCGSPGTVMPQKNAPSTWHFS